MRAADMENELEYNQSERTGIRRWLTLHPPLMPVATFLYYLFGKGLIFQGRAGMYYALQRLVAEATLSLMILEHQLQETAPNEPGENNGK